MLINFTGFDSPYEPPENPEVRIDTIDQNPDSGVDQILEHLFDSCKQ